MGSVRNAGLPLPSDDLFIVLITQSLRIAHDEGAWTGGRWLYAVPAEDEGGVGQDEPTWVLTGEGAFEGLTATLRPAFSGRDRSVASSSRPSRRLHRRCRRDRTL